jgi:hypothetical protein
MQLSKRTSAVEVKSLNLLLEELLTKNSSKRVSKPKYFIA